MGEIKKPTLVKLITGLIFKDAKASEKAKLILEKHLGKIDFASRELAFDLTDYYEKELGKYLKREFVSFKKLIPPSDLPKIKILTNKIEKNLSSDGNRLINIDPGYLDLAKLVLASTKDYKHRIYLAKGIFAEITLRYEAKSFRPWEWTYPDYKTGEYIEIFNQIRDIYAAQIKDKL
jgi:hypothetical protein